MEALYLFPPCHTSGTSSFPFPSFLRVVGFGEGQGFKAGGVREAAGGERASKGAVAVLCLPAEPHPV